MTIWSFTAYFDFARIFIWMYLFFLVEFINVSGSFGIFSKKVGGYLFNLSNFYFFSSDLFSYNYNPSAVDKSVRIGLSLLYVCNL